MFVDYFNLKIRFVKGTLIRKKKFIHCFTKDTNTIIQTYTR